MVELQRIASHLVWLGTHALDLAAMSVFLYAFREREQILDIFELVSGARLMTSYFRVGGLAYDLPDDFADAVRDFLAYMPAKLDEYEDLLTGNPLWLDRTVGVGVIDGATALAYGLTGPPPARHRRRLGRPAQGPCPTLATRPTTSTSRSGPAISTTATWCACSRDARVVQDRRQALRKPARGPGTLHDRRPQDRAAAQDRDRGTAWKSLIHHFKLWTEGFKPPKGEIYSAVESPRGELGVFLAGNGGPRPHRVHWRTPSFVNLQPLNLMSAGHFVADVVGIIGSVDIVLGDVDR